MRPSLLLNDARLSHDILVRELKAIYEKLDEGTKEDRFDNKVERLIVPFDLTLQLDLLKLALASKKKEESLAFLRGMGYFHYDILKFLKHYAEIRELTVEADYDNILALSEKAQKRVIDIANAGVEPLWDDALAAMAKADLIVEKDVFQIIQDNLYRIVDCFLMVDEENTDTDVRLAVENVRVHMLLPIIDSNDELFKRTEAKKPN